MTPSKIMQAIRRRTRTATGPSSRVGTRNEVTRDQWVVTQLSSIPAGSKILDAGAGEQKYRKHCGHLNYLSQDFCEYDGKGDSSALQTGDWNTAQTDIISDITSIPAPDQSFDAILCTEVLEHVPDPVAAVDELYRLLRDDGLLLITAPFCSLTHFSPFHYSSGLNRFWFEYHCKRLGLNIEELQPNGNFFEYLGQEVRRIEFCGKEFSSSALTGHERLAINDVLMALERLSALDKGSDSMLAFGFHLRCTRATSLPATVMDRNT